ncbi:MAG: polysulfide reductase NrfD [Thaumarchaeota archaeon]|nr:polysulfide reductase NrfD [Nitrososphaerota archaeon]
MTEHMANRSELLLDPLRWYTARYYLLVSVLLAVVGWGMYAYYVQFTTGLGVTAMRGVVSWGLYVVNFVFFIGISHVGALMSAILRLTNAEWRRPVMRMAEVVTFASLIVAALMPLIDLGRPDRIANTVIFARLQSPLAWDFLAIGTYFTGSVIFLYLPLIPDIATCRDRLSNASRLRRRIYHILSVGWDGSESQMQHLEKAIRTMTILIIPIAISVHTVVSWDFAMNLRTGWNSSIFGPYFVGGALFSGVATVILVMALLTKFYHLEAYITKKHFDNMGKLLLTLNIIVIYLTINEYLVPGYKFLQQSNLEGQWMTSLFWGKYAPLFWFQIIGGLIIPVFLVAIPRTRTVTGYFLAAILVNMGMWVERFNIVIPSLAVPQLNYPWGVYFPSWVEISITAGAFAGFTLIYLIFTKIFPIISIWETEVTEHAEPSKTLETHPGTSSIITVSEQKQRIAPTNRRGFLRSATIIAAGLTIGLSTSRLASGALGVTERAVEKTSVKQKTPLSNLGRSMSLSDVNQAAKFPVVAPLRLTDGSILKDIRVTENGERVSLLYGNPQMSQLSIYSEEVAVAIFEVPDPNIEGPPKYLPKGFFKVHIKDKEGFAREPIRRTVRDEREPGQMHWWSKGIRYSIFANLPEAELVKIASSMEDAQSV